jgi:DNA-binding GntR family transcriptional regulator
MGTAVRRSSKETDATLSDSIVDLIRQRILSGAIPPGKRLNESELARELKVSRAPIREAFRQLHEQGLATNNPRRGMFVVNLDEQDLQKINSLRLVLESEALRLARRNMTPQAERKLRQLLLKMERVASSPPFQIASADIEFHRAIWQMSGNEYLERMLTSVTAPIFMYATLLIVKGARKKLVLDSHEPILDWLLGKRTESAEQLMFDLLKTRWTTPARFSSFVSNFDESRPA